jgi:hypothetical protein
MEAESLPHPCIEKMDRTARPRVTLELDSDVMVEASGYSPPTPKPRIARQIASWT